MTLQVSLGSGNYYRRDNANNRGLMDRLLPRICRINIVLCNRRPGDNMAGHFWFEVYLLSQVLRERSKRLKEFRIAAYAPLPKTKTDRVNGEDVRNVGEFPFVPPPHDFLNGLPLHTSSCQISNHTPGCGTKDKHLLRSEPDPSAKYLQDLALMGKWIYAEDQNARRP
ncbi:hypothetical protein EK21DRAFT_114082 [Setomelanomma holmii]|uniref:Uncharacterized protein n=1 Tax=Setomelanomma holmii TaxID=210430 RepID=A0A9P4H741_9PLEO|nr:hypothetical protein EK21DRAFT_114082 [Setomelanomma holmii]